jgi:polysaccharide biosynthesis transport protein
VSSIIPAGADATDLAVLAGGGGGAAPAASIIGNDDAAPQLSIVAEYWRIILRRKWVILGCLIAGLAAGLLWNAMSSRMYTATSTIEISRDDVQVLEGEGVQRQSTANDQEFYQTQLGLLRSRALAERVARNLRLSRDPAFREAFGFDAEESETNASVPRSSRQAAEAELRRIRDVLLAHVAIAPPRNSRLHDISVTTPDAALSARIADAWAQGFIEANIARGLDQTQFARTFLEAELQRLRQRLEQSERLAVGYATRNGILLIQTTNESGEGVSSQSLTEQSLVAYNTELAEAVANRVAAEAAFRAGASATPSADGAALAVLRQRRAELSAEYRQLLVQFEPQYPAARAIAEQIAQLDRSIGTEESRSRRTQRGELQALYRAALARENGLRARVGEATGRVSSERNASIQYAILQRDVDNNRQLYDAILQRFKEVGVAAGVGRTNVALVDRADVPGAPSAPNLPLNLLLGGLIGVLAGFVFTIVREQIDIAINDPAEVDRQIGLPLLGTLPDFGGNPDAVHDLLADPKSMLSDATLSLRTRIGFTTTHGFPRTIAVTSSLPAEGKSTMALALANGLVATRKRVLLIDADMRSPSVNELVGVSNATGLANALAGEDDLGSLIVRPKDYGFDVMAAGPNPPNAAELLASDRMQTILSLLQSRYDYIVFDAPPVIGLADALLVSANVEATLYVIRAHATRVNEVRVALQRLRGVPNHIIGAALTHYDQRHSAYGYGYGYDYGDKQSSAKPATGR